MPMIDVTVPAGALSDDAKDALVEQLVPALLRWEGAPDNDLFRSITWAYVDERPAGRVYVGGRPADDDPRFRVVVTVPEGALSDRRKQGVVEEMTRLVLEAAGQDPADAEAAFKVWVLVNELGDGGWGAAGRVWRYADLVALAKGGAPAEPAATV